MKINIEKMQQGGGFATFTPVVNSTPAQTPSKQSAQGAQPSSSILDDVTFKELMTKGGLVNDTNSLVSELAKMETSMQNPYTQSSNRGLSLRLIGKVNELRQSKELWKEAMMTSKANGGLGEVAVGGYGEVYTKDKNNNVVAMSLSDFKESDEKPKLLTVGELMNERQYNPNLTGRNDLFNAANNSIGLSKITDHVKGLIHSLGREIIDNSQVYSKEQATAQARSTATSLGVKPPTQEDVKSLNILNQVINGATDYSRVDEKGNSQRKHLDQALDYIWGTLGTNAQQKLTATAILNGSNDPRKYLMEMLYSETSESSTTHVTPIKTPGVSSLVNHDKPLTAFEVFNNGKTGKQVIQWNEPSTGKTMNLVATAVSRLSDSKGNVFGQVPLANVLNSDQGMLVKSDKAFFGDKLISPIDMQNIVYDGNEAAKVYMPMTSSGAPDYARLDEVKKLEQEAFSHKDWSPAKINDFFAQHGYGYVKVNNDREYIINDRFKPFLLMYGYTAQGANATQGNSRIKLLAGTEKDNAAALLDNVWTKYKIKKPTDWTQWGTDYYKGAIAIPYKEDSSIYAAAISRNLLAPQTSIDTANVNKNIEEGTVINPSSQFLFNQ